MTSVNWEAAAREAGWLPPDEVERKVWAARHLRGGGERCSHCGAVRVRGPINARWWASHDEPMPHRTYCQFYTGPVKHAFASGRMGSLGFRVYCTCGRSYPDVDADGNKNECPDATLTYREATALDLTA